MNLIPWRKPAVEERDSSFGMSLQQYFNDFFTYNGVGYGLGGTQTLAGNTETVKSDFTGLIQGAYQSNGIVFACMLTRMLHFCEPRFQYRQSGGRGSGQLQNAPSLRILQNPWPGGSTRALLARAIQDVDLAGNFYAVRQGSRLVRLRPDWVSIVLGSTTNDPSWEPGDPDTTLIGYQYNPGGLYSGREPYRYFPEQVAHWAPIPDPLAYYRGMSWLTPVIREIQADIAMTSHREKFFQRGATVNHVATIPAVTVEAFEKWVDKLEEGHAGLANAYKTVYLGAGADMKAIGSDMQQIDFKAVQGAGEVRVATAARIPATILGISEGLQGSTLNAGNYASARRNFADGLLRPLWGSICSALETILTVPNGLELWYDDRDIAFLKEDIKDAASVRQADATTANSLINAGFEPDAVIDAITSDDFSKLSGQHTGLTSVQLQPPGTSGDANSDTQTAPPSIGTQTSGTV